MKKRREDFPALFVSASICRVPFRGLAFSGGRGTAARSDAARQKHPWFAGSTALFKCEQMCYDGREKGGGAMDRIILHCDLNSFYASVELRDHPDLRDVPTAVCGDPTSRHGIILAKN